MTACDDNESSSNDAPTISAGYSDTLTIEADRKTGYLHFDSQYDWTASIEEDDATYVTFSRSSGEAGENIKILVKMSSDNAGNPDRLCHALIRSSKGELRIPILHRGSTLTILTADQITDYDKYYKPAEFANINMLREDAKWSWVRSKQSEHFFVFWEAGFGSDPNASTLPAGMRVDIDDLLQKAEQFYTTNVEILKMCTVGEGKSYLDKYKMEIYLLYQTEWLATGSGYDNVIGALWVNPSTCQPVGSTIAHEIGHSFQYQTYCDKLYRGGTDDLKSGYRYGFGPNGRGGCAFWEQCAQWQSFQDYPAEAYSQTYSLYTHNCHRHYNHEWMRYQSVWFAYYMVQRHGVESYGRLWQESYYPEDPLETYTRLFCNGDLETFYDRYYEYATRAVTYDFGDIQQYVPSDASSHFGTTMLNVDGKYRPAYANCVGTTGFNVICLNSPTKGATVQATLNALAPGSALAPTDAGTQIDEDGTTVANRTTYNDNVYNGTTYTCSGYRFGFVGVKGGKATYGTPVRGASGTATMSIDDDYDEFYLVVVATPTTYVRHYWDAEEYSKGNEANDLQWPYEVSFDQTDLLGNVTIQPGSPTNVSIDVEVSCDASTNAYELGSINLLKNGVMAQMANAFKLQPAEIAAACNNPAAGSTGTPSEGKIVIGMSSSTGSVAYNYTANTGFWCDANGNVVNWGNGQAVYVEFNPSSYLINYGHMYGVTKAGTTYTLRPTYVYTHNGVQYKAVINLKMKY